jgi:hypothetical protein
MEVMVKNDSRIRKSYENKTLGGYINIETIDDENKNELSDVEFRYNMIYDKFGVLQNSTEIWEQKLNEVKKYIDENQKRPSAVDKDKNVRFIGEWIRRQLFNYKRKIKNMRQKDIYDKWTAFVNDEKYKKYFYSYVDVWCHKLEHVKRYIDENNKKPSMYDKNKEICKLGLWFNHQINNYKNKTELMINQNVRDIWYQTINDDKYRKYLLTTEEEWFYNFENLKIFIDTNNRRPSTSDINEIDRNLGTWLSHQITYYKQKTFIMKNEIINDIWTNFIFDEKYKKYFMSNTEMWIYKLGLIKQYIQTHNKKPSPRDKNKHIMAQGVWIMDQIKHYKIKHKSMDDVNIRCELEKFMTDETFNKYFKNVINDNTVNGGI